jgi:peptidoglycan/xylan/chitin deacetylase (PgdA/CDA1 family)
MTTKTAYLTFDDGPSAYTEQLLAVLNEHDVSGIFFVMGNQIKTTANADEILQRIIHQGHFIGLHTMTHDMDTLYKNENSAQTFIDEMLQLRAELHRRVGWETNLCRAPYGKKGQFTPAHHQAVADNGLYCIDWHLSSRDWEKQTAAEIVDQVTIELKQHQNDQELVVLLHEYQRTVDALPQIIALLKEHGYAFAPYVEGHIFAGLE